MDSHRVGSGRVTIFVGRVGSSLEIWTRVQLCGICRPGWLKLQEWILQE